MDTDTEERKLQELKAELQEALAAPESRYLTITLEEFPERMKLKRNAALARGNQRPKE